MPPKKGASKKEATTPATPAPATPTTAAAPSAATPKKKKGQSADAKVAAVAATTPAAVVVPVAVGDTQSASEVEACKAKVAAYDRGGRAHAHSSSRRLGGERSRSPLAYEAQVAELRAQLAERKEGKDEKLSAAQKFEIITRGCVNDEPNTLLNGEAIKELKSILEVRDLKLYWGTATTGTPHVAYFVPMSKIADFLRAGCEVTILLADLHAFLDNQKAPWELLSHRVKYYQEVIVGMLEALGVSVSKLKFVRGTEFQLSREYNLDMYRLSSKTSERNAKKAGAEVVKQVDNAPLSGLLYPLLQALDEEYLHVDAQFGGLDQRKIFVLAEESLPKHLGYKKRIHLMNPMVPGLDGGKGNKAAGDAKPAAVEKMSSSGNSKIDLLDSPEIVSAKIGMAYAAPGEVAGNGLLAFVRMVLFTVHNEFKVEREAKFGGTIVFKTYADVEKAYAEQSLYPLDLKHAVAVAINRLLAPIRKKFESAEMQKLMRLAYPEKYVDEKVAEVKTEAPATVSAPATVATDAAATPAAEPKKAKKPKDPKGGDPARRAAAEAAAAAATPATAPATETKKEAKKEAPKQQQQQPKKAAGGAAKKAAADLPEDIRRFDLRVGKIISCTPHPDPEAKTLLVEEIDVGEGTPRTVVSGIANFYKPDELKGRLVVVLCNIKEGNVRKVRSQAMVLAACNDDKSKVELIQPDAESKVGERLRFEGFPVDLVDLDVELPKANEKVLKNVMAELHTDDEGVVCYHEGVARSGEGEVKAQSLFNSKVM